MSDVSDIEWLRTYAIDGSFTKGGTWNPVRGCDKISPGCKNCYAETFAERWRGIPGHPFEQGFDLRLVPDALDKPLKWKRGRRIFVNSMSDLFHEGVPFEYIAAVFGVMAACPRHTFKVLTKRADRMVEFFEWLARQTVQVNDGRGAPAGFICLAHAQRYCEAPQLRQNVDEISARRWPLPNVWIGVSVENQKYANERIPQLLKVPAVVRWISAEPLLDEIWIEKYLPGNCVRCGCPYTADGSCMERSNGCQGGRGEKGASLDWVVVGGESGQRSRSFNLYWARILVGTCIDAEVAVFVKQLGDWTIGAWYPEPYDGPGLIQIGKRKLDFGPAPPQAKGRWALDKAKGGDIAEFPADLQVREYPRLAT
jgi:protein gp37